MAGKAALANEREPGTLALDLRTRPHRHGKLSTSALQPKLGECNSIGMDKVLFKPDGALRAARTRATLSVTSPYRSSVAGSKPRRGQACYLIRAAQAMYEYKKESKSPMSDEHVDAMMSDDDENHEIDVSRASDAS